MGRALKAIVFVLAVVAIVFAALAAVLLRAPEVYDAADLSDVEELRFFALGDQGTLDIGQWRVAQQMESHADSVKPHFAVLLGDNFYHQGVDSVDDWRWRTTFENIYRGPHLSRIPFFSVLGNHDTDGNAEAQIEYSNGHGSGRWQMPARHYVRDFGKRRDCASCPLVRMVFLDTTRTATKILDESRFVRASFEDGNPQWRITASHHPLRNRGKYQEHPTIVGTLLPALLDSGTHLHLAGHDHNQQLIHLDGEPLYLINGNGGKGGDPVRRKNDPALFAYGEGLGFASIRVDQDSLTVELVDIAKE